jgi:hypothetical protein
MRESSDRRLAEQWAIPYTDQDPSFWEEIAGRFGPHIQEVYFPIPSEVTATGRGAQPAQYLEAFLHGSSLPKSVLINPIVLSRPVEEMAPRILDALRSLHGDYGVERATLAHPALARIIKEALPFYRITASILMDVSTPFQTLLVKEYVDAIVASGRLLRDVHGLQKLRQAFSGEIRLIVNEGCLPGCPFRIQHFYEMSYGNSWSQSLCQPTLAAQPWLRLTGAWILPRHLRFYAGLYDSLKLAGRVTLRDPAKYLTVLRAYLQREPILPRDIGGGPASMLEAIDLPDDLFEKILYCGKNCPACSLCRDYYDRAVAECISRSPQPAAK